MNVPAAKDRIIRLFQDDARSVEPLSFQEVLDRLPYGKGTVSARLSELVTEGTLRKAGRGEYLLNRTDRELPDPLKTLVGQLVELFPEDTLWGTVVWDATPMVAKTEDGAPGQVLLVELPRGHGSSGIASALRDHWSPPPGPPVRSFSTRATLLDAMAGRIDLDLAPGTDRVLVGPAEGRLAATALHTVGVRVAERERVLADLLDPGLLGGQVFSEAVRLELTSTRHPVRGELLIAAAKERGVLPSLFVLLGRLWPALPPALKERVGPEVGPVAWTVLDRGESP